MYMATSCRLLAANVAPAWAGLITHHMRDPGIRDSALPRGPPVRSDGPTSVSRGWTPHNLALAVIVSTADQRVLAAGSEFGPDSRLFDCGDLAHSTTGVRRIRCYKLATDRLPVKWHETHVTCLPYLSGMGPVDNDLELAVMALREVFLASEQYRHAAAAQLGLDVSSSQAVSYLLSRGEMGQSELGALLGFNTSSVTALVDRLEQRQIARRRPHPTDRRRSIIELTDYGRSEIERARRWFVQAFDDIAPTQLASLAAALDSIAANLRRTAASLDG